MKKNNKNGVFENNKNLQKRKTNNPNGRPKGVPNKTTNELKTFIIHFIDENLQTIQHDFEMLSAEKKLFFFEKILQYVMPKATPTETPQEIRPLIIEVSSEEAKQATEKFINSDD